MKKLLKEDADVFLQYENTKAEPITQMTPNKFLHICRIIYDSWKAFFLEDAWYQYNDDASNEVVYCHFKMMGLDETAWYGHKDVMDSYIYGTLAKPGYYVGGYHFEELEFGGLKQDLIPIDTENGSCIVELYSRINFEQDNPCDKSIIELILAYNECLKNGYYVELNDKKRIVAYVRRIYEKL